MVFEAQQSNSFESPHIPSRPKQMRRWHHINRWPSA